MFIKVKESLALISGVDEEVIRLVNLDHISSIKPMRFVGSLGEKNYCLLILHGSRHNQPDSQILVRSSIEAMEEFLVELSQQKAATP